MCGKSVAPSTVTFCLLQPGVHALQLAPETEKKTTRLRKQGSRRQALTQNSPCEPSSDSDADLEPDARISQPAGESAQVSLKLGLLGIVHDSPQLTSRVALEEESH